jgi:AcrR family transcriptional regulator
MTAAKVALAEVGADVSLEEIARRSNAGVATAYRNFPTRDAIIEAVYRAEVEHLANAAPQLLAAMPAAEALHKWMHLSVDFVATKRGLASALGFMVKEGSELYGYSIGLLTQATTLLVERAIADGAIRDDVTAIDLLRAQIGFFLRQSPPGLAGKRPASCRYLFRWPQVQDVSVPSKPSSAARRRSAMRRLD